MKLNEESVNRGARISKILLTAGGAATFAFVVVNLILLISARNLSYNNTAVLVATSVILACTVISAAAAICGAVIKRKTEKAVFLYCAKITADALKTWCRGTNLRLLIDISDGSSAVFTVYDEAKYKTASYDLTCSLPLGNANAFLAGSVGMLADRLLKQLNENKKFNTVSYKFNDEGSFEQYLIQGGKPNDRELEATAKLYKRYAKGKDVV